MNEPWKNALELMVDAEGLDGVVAALAEICGEKAEHLTMNWQDVTSAKVWLDAMKRLDKQIQHMPGYTGPHAMR